MMKRIGLFIIGILSIVNLSLAQQLPIVIPEEVGLNTVHLLNIDRVVEEAISRNEIPGAVIAIVKDNKIGYLKSFGNKQTYPKSEAMDINTVFDLASCTKPLATAISTMILVERGYISLYDEVKKYIVSFQPYYSLDGENSDIRIIDLLTHTSGLPAYAPVSELIKKGGDTKEVLKDYISTCKRLYKPTTDCKYSCLNYITLQYIIESVTKESLQEFTQKNIYKPLKLSHTTFCPSDDMRENIAPTELQKDGNLLKGEVHDPLARLMNRGVSGNAGLFSNAKEVAILSSLFLNNGKVGNVQIISPASVSNMSKIPNELFEFGRTIGWDMNSPYSSVKGELLSSETFCHTGYTGTSIVIDPINKVSIIVLTNRVHPYDKGKVGYLRKQISNIVAGAIGTANNKGYIDHYKKRNDEFANDRRISNKSIVFLGDSHIENGGDWSKRLKNKHIVNRGIIGDNTKGVLNRLNEILQHKPKAILLSIGVNDVSQGLNNHTIIENIEEIISKIKKDSPKTEILLHNMMPFNEEKSWYRLLKGKSSVIEEANLMLLDLANKHKIKFISSYNKVCIEGTNQLKKEITRDGLHLTDEGYKILEEVFKLYF